MLDIQINSQLRTSLKKLASRNAKCQLKEYEAEHGLTIPILQINPDREAFFHLVLVAGIHAREVKIGSQIITSSGLHY